MKLRAVRPNVGLEVWYRKRLEREIAEMAKSVAWWVGAAYRAQEPRIDLAADAAPADVLEKVLASLRKRWGKRFDKLGAQIADKFAARAGATTDDAIEAAMRAAGMRVKFQASKAQRDQLAGVVQQNVSLIRSIPEQYFTSVEGAVQRSVLAGRDLATLTEELKASYGVTHRRAAFISLDQNNKSTAFLTRTRQMELNLDEAQWVHSGAGQPSARQHVQAGRDKVIYRVSEGWLDPATGKRIWPGTEPGCRCTCRSIIKLPFEIEMAA